MRRPQATSLPKSMAGALLVLASLALLPVPTASGRSEGTLGATLDYELSGTLGRHGWWVSDVTINWIATPEPDSTTCIMKELVEGDTPGERRTCEARWADEGVRTATTEVIKIDKTPPSSVRARARRRPDLYGWYDHRVRFVFRGADALSGVTRCSRRSYDGPNSGRASITGLCKDAAGNIRKRTIRFRYSNPLLLPRPGTRFGRAPLLNWVRVPRARYYNVQVWRDGGKILTRWPRRTRLRMHTLWTNEGLTYALSAGRYDVYVWPRFRGRYGKSIGHTYFIKR